MGGEVKKFDDGGPAYPAKVKEKKFCTDLAGNTLGKDMFELIEVEKPGMTWLDECAMRIQAAIITSPDGLQIARAQSKETGIPIDRLIANDAYLHAQALLAEKRRLESGAE